MMNGTEYLEHLFAMGIKENDLPGGSAAVTRRRSGTASKPGDGPEKLAKAIEDLQAGRSPFHMEGGSWTNDISWVKGYENMLGPMEKPARRSTKGPGERRRPPTEHRAIRNALYPPA